MKITQVVSTGVEVKITQVVSTGVEMKITQVVSTGVEVKITQVVSTGVEVKITQVVSTAVNYGFQSKASGQKQLADRLAAGRLSGWHDDRLAGWQAGNRQAVRLA